jgi:hypothetical protein
MYISSIALCKNEEEANKAASGWIPDNACKDYASLIENLKPTPYFVAGDATGDGAINFMDSFKTKTFIKNIDVPTREESYASDVNGDGVINLVDTFELKYRITKGNWRY